MGCQGCKDTAKAEREDAERVRGQRNRALNVLVAIAGRIEDYAEAQERTATPGAAHEALEDIGDVIDQWLAREENLPAVSLVSRETSQQEEE